MSISYIPNDAIFDQLPVSSQSFRAVRRTVVNRTRGRTVDVDESPFVRWVCDITLNVLTPQQDALFQKFITSIGPGTNGFRCYDKFRQRPILDTGTFDINATVVSASGNSVSVSGMPPGKTISFGDYFSIQETVTPFRSRLHVMDYQLQFDVSGTGTLETTFPVQGDNLVGGTVSFVKPSCTMHLISPYSRAAEAVLSQVSFTVEEIG